MSFYLNFDLNGLASPPVDTITKLLPNRNLKIGKKKDKGFFLCMIFFIVEFEVLRVKHLLS